MLSLPTSLHETILQHTSFLHPFLILLNLNSNDFYLVNMQKYVTLDHTYVVATSLGR